MAHETVFRAALDAIAAGDAPTLEAHLRAHPHLVHARSQELGPPYDGYFREATLLHHLAFNPDWAPPVPNVLQLADVLLAAGARVDSLTNNGDWSWTPLSLAASGKFLAEQGLAISFIEKLIHAGADVNLLNGLSLYGAIFHYPGPPQLLEIAHYLVAQGHELDVAYAAACGLEDAVASFFTPDGQLQPGAYRLYRTRDSPYYVAHPTRQEVLNEALVWACKHDFRRVAEQLFAHGAQLNAFAPIGYEAVTPLHAAVWSASDPLVHWLVELGADKTLRSPNHDATPHGWAQHFGRTGLLELLSP